MPGEFEVVSNPQFRNLHVFVVRMMSRTPHIHRELEVGYILRGSAALRLGGQTVRLRAMDGYLINPLEVHEFRCEARDALILAVQVSPRILDSFLSEAPPLRYGGGPELRKMLGDPPDHQRLLQLCLALARSYLKREEGHEYECFALTAGLLALLGRAAPREALSREAWQPIRQRRERIVAVVDFIDENFHRKLLLEEIARRMGLTMPYLSHLIREAMGMSFQDYLKKRRFEHARSLILSTDRSLLDISLESGFSDTRYMIRMFEEEFGCTPREYRRQKRHVQASQSAPQGNAQDILGAQEALRLLDAFASGAFAEGGEG